MKNLGRSFWICPLLALGLPLGADELRFEVSFSPEARSTPLTGRVYVVLAVDDSRAPRDQIEETGVPFFGANVEELGPGEAAVIDAGTFGYPMHSVADLPAGDYYVQGFVNTYAEYPRADGHTLWLREDPWEGQFRVRAPASLYSEPRRVHVDPAAGGVIDLVCDRAVAPLEVPPDTEYVKRFRFQSELLSEFWGRPMYLGATVLLPEGYGEHPELRYPVDYHQAFFSHNAPGGFGRGPFTNWWKAEDTPRFVLVNLLHPTPYGDMSYAVNSQNCGPYGDAILQELIPEVERRFRVRTEPRARLLSGGMRGAWAALALQIQHPDAFGGCWASSPDPVDFRSYQLVDIYADDNAYWTDHGLMRVERPSRRQADGNVRYMMKDENWLELATGDRGRSNGQWDLWQAVFSPLGADGYPAPLWDKLSGEIDHQVADHWREHYDLRHLLERDWELLAPKLQGKLHVYTGDMAAFYYNLGVRKLAEFLEDAQPPLEYVIEFVPMQDMFVGPEVEQRLLEMAAHLER